MNEEERNEQARNLFEQVIEACTAARTHNSLALASMFVVAWPLFGMHYIFPALRHLFLMVSTSFLVIALIALVIMFVCDRRAKKLSDEAHALLDFP